MYLSELLPKESATLLAIKLPKAKKLRLMELGMIPGARVLFLGTPPTGDPMILWLPGYKLAIKRRDAACISIKKQESKRPD